MPIRGNRIDQKAPGAETRKGDGTMEEIFHRNMLAPGERGTVLALRNDREMRRRLMDLGLIESTPVECLGRSPGGDPAAYLVRGAVLAIRDRDSEQILIRREEGGSR